MGRHDHQQQSLLPPQKIIEGQNAFALWCAKLSFAQQSAEAAVGGPVARISQDVGRAVDKDEAAADEQSRRLDPGLSFYLLQAVIEAHHPGEGVAVGDADRGKTVARCLDRDSCGREAPRKNE